jgi:WD40 repeat-containing protein SMU1
LEQRLAALVSLRNLNKEGTANNPLPPNFYGKDSTKQERRDDIGQRLTDTIPVVPPSRLTSLLQQAVKWQAYTGQLPRVRNHWEEDETIPDDNNNEEGDQPRPRKRKRKAFNLVLGNVDIDPVNVGDIPVEDAVPLDPIPSKPYTTIKFGKKATAESAIFAPDETADGPSTTTYSLITGSSDGLVELYDAHSKYSSLRMDLPYQEKDELIGHDDESSVLALAASHDGTMLATGSSNGQVQIWRISTGKCLRKIHAHQGSVVSCVAFSPDASHILTGSQDSNCREFGLRTSRMLKEFNGHASYIHSCQYVLRKGGHQLCVVTSSADGTVRLWNAKTSEALRVFRPVSLGDSMSVKGSSLVVDHRSDLTSGAGGSPAVHTVLHLHTPADSMIVVPRGLRAFLVDYHGTVWRTFEDNGSAGKLFVAATVSPSNHWLYCVNEDGVCCIFDIVTGKLEKSIRNFGEETTAKSKDGGAQCAEITAIVHHPHKGILAAFSNDKVQKKGQLVLWK